jgi:8-oxo-dGTP pyrophosphatase MutT (NUDIX family)
MTMDQSTRRVNVRAIIFKEGKLFAQQLKVNGGINAFWSTPGGGLDPNESLIDGL